MITKNHINIFLIGLISFVYGAIDFLNSPKQVSELVSLSLYRPFVYRQLVPELARLLMLTGLGAELSIVLIMTLSGIGFYLSLQRLASLIYKGKTGITVFLMISIGMVLFSLHRMPYDLMTAFLFTLAFSLLAEWRYKEYMLLFPVICLNRETAFLLAVFYFVVLLNKQKILLKEIGLFVYQVVIWFGVRLLLNIIFYNNGGLDAWIEPFENILKFIHDPFTTVLHLSITAVLLYLVIKDWSLKPGFFKIAFVVLAPLLVVMYVVLGQAFEVRVFWEIYPIVIVLSIPTIEKLAYNFQRPRRSERGSVKNPSSG